MPVISKLNVSNKDLTTTSLDRTDFEQQDNKTLKVTENIMMVCYSQSFYFENDERSFQYNMNPVQGNCDNSDQENVDFAPNETQHASCSICHIPYNEANVSFRMTISNCAMCK